MEFSTFLFLAINILFLLFSFTYSHQDPSSPKHTILTDLEPLLAFKAQLGDPFRMLATNWTTNTSFCSWIGITCIRQRVTSIDLHNISLQGTISPHLANISFLSLLNLRNCTLTGSIPRVLGQLPRLEKLVLEQNYLSGSIPFSIFNMSSLITLLVAYNNLSGSLPSNDTSFIVLPSLVNISLSANHFTGEIPSSFAQCRDLQGLSLSMNQFTGTIPANLGSLPDLTLLYLGGNQLTGTIPASLGNLTKLTSLDLSYNKLGGVIPHELGNIPNLQYLILGSCGLTGSVPASVWNASMLIILEFAYNSLTGPVPATLGKSMPLLTQLLIGKNQLTGGLEFITSLSNCKDLQYLELSYNWFEGVLPSSTGNLSSSLQYFVASNNNIRGKIPTSVSNLSNLISLDLGRNELTGEIPILFAMLENLERMSLDRNKISGSIPSELGLLARLSILFLQNNKLVGPIPDSLSNISRLQQLSLSANRLSSSIPNGLWNLISLNKLNLSQNILGGLLPSQVGNLKALDVLDLSLNRLSGNISSALGQLQMLSYMDLSDNSFEGQIPNLGGLVNVEYLNFSKNFLSGVIPNSLGNLPYLSSVDLSFNKLEGQIPKGRVFSNFTVLLLLEGNKGLCGAPLLHFRPCPQDAVTTRSKEKLHFLICILPPLASIVLILAALCLVRTVYKRMKTAKGIRTVSPGLGDPRVFSHLELVRATENFSEANLLGRGSFGSVFKGSFDDGLTVAVKVLNLELEGASKSFDTECQAMSMVRHRNLIKIISICSNLDFKALLLQFMPKGSLDQWLHSDSNCLTLLQRLNIMMDVSSALEYLHHRHHYTVLHCDLKPSNVLLDDEMIAHVGDFGIAKLLHGDSRSIASASTAGTVGYIAPEFGSSGIVSRMGDVYSFGILLLETFTGKKPTDVMFDGESNLREWVCKAHPAAFLDIVDYNLLEDCYRTERRPGYLSSMHLCLSSVIELGLLCSRFSPGERIPMTDVVSRLQRIKLDYALQVSFVEQ